MSHVTFDIQWKEAMQELAKLTDDEIPSDASLAPKTLAQYSCIYVRYLQVYKKLEECCDQIVHSQKRIEAKKALEACIGRMLEIRSWLVTLNEGRDFVNFDATLVCLNVGPEVLDVLPPRNLIDDNATSLETREKFLANERGRQGRQKIVELTKTRQMQEEALRHQQSGGESMSHEAAAIIMQSAARSFLARCRIKKSEDDELTLIGMNGFSHSPISDLALSSEKENAERRKKIQLLNKAEFEEAMTVARHKVKELEGQEMREIIQEKINQWLISNRDPETGFYPSFPKPEEGGSKQILEPSLELEFSEDEKKKNKKKDGKDTEDVNKKKTKGGQVPPKRIEIPHEDDEKPPTYPVFFLRHLRDCVQAYKNLWHDRDDYSNLHQKHDQEILKSTLRPAVFEEVRRLVLEYCVFPLISDFVHEHAPFIKSVLLYGGDLNGKTLLVHAACRATGAAFINLSPSNTDDKYPGKQAGRMLQMAFKVAKIMAPSIVYISEVEKIFVTDKKKLKTFRFKDKCNRIKKSLIKEVEALKPGDRVLILGTSSQPQDAPSKPPAFFNLFTKRIYIPYPDYSSRMTLWRTMIEKKGGVLTNKFDLSTLAHISSGYSNGIIDKVCAITITEKRKRKLRRFPLLIDELTYHLYRSKPVDPICLQTLLEWGKPSQELEEPLKEKLGAKTKGSGKIDVKR
ncbi:hypothetical protein O6H91_01G041400 [Diphasiastrum complanatum]|uniref:Uncharacterized protein n=1 Tax=Diphasiastrum complanatum TaxID=34168 RepID=A0ACC2EQ57_DIPCM|nr:hypothetical protein O6H91_01G041400 [Diphasiastrum complanatum]